MIATNIEQSKKLLELGLKPETADMFWPYHEKWYSEGEEWEGYEDFPRAEPYLTYTRKDLEWENPKEDIPAWSLSALLELIPKFITEKNEKYILRIIPTNNNQIEMCYWNKFSGGLISDYIRKDSFMESAYNMTVWLLETGYIKK